MKQWATSYFHFRIKLSAVFLLFYSCSADSIRLDTSMDEETAKLALNELFEVGPNFLCFNSYFLFCELFLTSYCGLSFWPQFISEECQHGPLILFLRDTEKFVSGSTDIFLSMKGKIDSLPAGVLAVCSSTQMDCHREKVIPSFSYLILWLVFSICFDQLEDDINCSVCASGTSWQSSFYKIWTQPSCNDWFCFRGKV